MKKTLIALAAVAAVGAASAQVTVYGKADVGITTSGSGVSVVSGGYEGSRIGVKGSTDLGSGLTGAFKLEGAANAADGTFTGFAREANASVSGAFGNVTAGLQWSIYDNAIYYMDAMEYNGFTATNTFYGYDVGNTGNGNVKNSIQYSTPVMAGLQAQVLVAPNAGATGTTNYNGMGLSFNQGPLALNFATQSYDSTANVKSWALAGSYNLGVATVYGGTTATDDTAAASKSVGNTVGLKVPMGAGYATVGYGMNTTTVASVDTKSNSMAAQYIYNWNKSAVIYAGFRSTVTTLTTNLTGVGVRYNF